MFERIQFVLKTLRLGLGCFQVFGSIQIAAEGGLSACLAVLEIGLQLVLGEFHSRHFCRLLFKLVPKVSDHLVALRHLRA